MPKPRPRSRPTKPSIASGRLASLGEYAAKLKHDADRQQTIDLLLRASEKDPVVDASVRFGWLLAVAAGRKLADLESRTAKDRAAIVKEARAFRTRRVEQMKARRQYARKLLRTLDEDCAPLAGGAAAATREAERSLRSVLEQFLGDVDFQLYLLMESRDGTRADEFSRMARLFVGGASPGATTTARLLKAAGLQETTVKAVKRTGERVRAARRTPKK